MNVAGLFSLCPQSRRSAQVGLISKRDHESSLLAIGRVLDYPWRNFFRD
jgi:hypothetical protein